MNENIVSNWWRFKCNHCCLMVCIVDHTIGLRRVSHTIHMPTTFMCSVKTSLKCWVSNKKRWYWTPEIGCVGLTLTQKSILITCKFRDDQTYLNLHDFWLWIVTVGVGSAWKIAKVAPRSTVAVFGLGTIGLAVSAIYTFISHLKVSYMKLM